ncbi:ABC transporter permease [Phytoactinopolyspora mesophila]|uniref:ABC transporter permease n=1 Tax=Phytoactinopolyspora mesophila TaxID=2650750 RepID=UPI001C9E4D78
MSLRAYALQRIAFGVVQVLGVATLVFVLTEALPGDAAVVVAGDTPDAERIERLRAAMELDRPVVERYLGWLGGLARGDLGASLISERAVTDTIRSGLPPTVLLAGVTMVLLIPTAFLLGVVSARRPGGAADRVISGITLSFYSVPEFAAGVLLIAVFSVHLNILPANALGYVGELAQHPPVLILPITVLLIRPLCSVSRLVRAGLIDALQSPYVAHARRLGISSWRVLWMHALPSSGGAAVQQLARTADWLLGGVIVVEAIFVIPGLGTTLVESVGNRDVPVMQGLAVLFAATTIAVNIAADVVTYRLNPQAVAR